MVGRQWLPAGHVVWLVIEAVRLLDILRFHALRRTGGAGAAGYDPDMMVTLLVWAYANGITSSRRDELEKGGLVTLAGKSYQGKGPVQGQEQAGTAERGQQGPR